jgi:hypothetical protein
MCEIDFNLYVNYNHVKLLVSECSLDFKQMSKCQKEQFEAKRMDGLKSFFKVSFSNLEYVQFFNTWIRQLNLMWIHTDPDPQSWPE